MTVQKQFEVEEATLELTYDTPVLDVDDQYYLKYLLNSLDDKTGEEIQIIYKDEKLTVEETQGLKMECELSLQKVTINTDVIYYNEETIGKFIEASLSQTSEFENVRFDMTSLQI